MLSSARARRCPARRLSGGLAGRDRRSRARVDEQRQLQARDVVGAGDVEDPLRLVGRELEQRLREILDADR